MHLLGLRRVTLISFLVINTIQVRKEEREDKRESVYVCICMYVYVYDTVCVHVYMCV